jgi:hypothetical protein
LTEEDLAWVEGEINAHYGGGHAVDLNVHTQGAQLLDIEDGLAVASEDQKIVHIDVKEGRNALGIATNIQTVKYRFRPSERVKLCLQEFLECPPGLRQAVDRLSKAPEKAFVGVRMPLGRREKNRSIRLKRGVEVRRFYVCLKQARLPETRSRNGISQKSPKSGKGWDAGRLV